GGAGCGGGRRAGRGVRIVLAALREPMLRLAARIADGAFTNFLPLSRVGQVLDAFGSPDKELACRFFSFHGDDALERAGPTFVAYPTLPPSPASFPRPPS